MLNMQTTSCLSNLINGVISLPEATKSCDKTALSYEATNGSCKDQILSLHLSNILF